MTNTHILDNRDQIKKIDSNNALGSIEEIGSQITQVWDLVKSIKLDDDYSKVDKVVVAGMGGSILGTDVIKNLFKDQLQVPVLVAPDYHLPAFVDEKTLVIASSYSGNTEETLSATKDAHAKGAKLLGITTGGKISQFFRDQNLPVLIYDPQHNPSQCARMGLGYSIFGQIALFAKAKLISFVDGDYQNILEAVATAHLKFGQQVTQDQNPAKVLAFNLSQKIPVITVSEHLEGVAHVFANQLNENAKNFAEYRVVPELNHHLMEGLKFPNHNDSTLLFVSIQSDLYHPSNQLRMTLTEEIFDKNNLEFVTHKLTEETKNAQAFELITMGAYTAFYLAMLNNENPIPNPYVDWFKKELKIRSK